MEISRRKKSKKIILKPTENMISSNKELADFISKVRDKIDLLYIDPSLSHVDLCDTNIKIIYPSKDADYVILKNLAEANSLVTNDQEKKLIGFYKKVHSNQDIQEVKNLSDQGFNFVIIDVDDWKIIPLENIIAALQKTKTEIFALAKSSSEVETLFSVLELGVDGVIISTDNEQDIQQINDLIHKISFNIEYAKILEIKDIGIGERVCIDTVSMLHEGEGMLVGNKSNFLFLVHNESIGSSFTSPRPFRVNAGAVHCYTVIPDGTTKYLSELESGSQVLVVNKKGTARTVSVGRSKIETRPLILFKAITDSNNEIGTIIVQNAETIRFLDKEGKILPVTHAKVGDEILVYSNRPTGRHFGMEVSDEYILEK